LAGVNPIPGLVIDKAVQESIKCLEGLIVESIRKGSLPENTDTRILALAIQNIMMGLNTMSKIVKSEQELWPATRATLKALKVYRE